MESLDVARGVRLAGARETVSKVTMCFPRALGQLGDLAIRFCNRHFHVKGQ